MSEHLPSDPSGVEVPPEPLSALGAVSQELAGWLEDYNTRPKELQPAISGMMQNLLFKKETLDTLQQDEHYTDEALNEYMDTLSAVQKATDALGWRQLLVLPAARLRSQFDTSSPFHDVLEGAALQMAAPKASLQDKHLLGELFQTVSSARFGESFNWRAEQGTLREGMPEYMRPFVEDPDFAHTALAMVSNQREHETKDDFLNRVRISERAILERCTPVKGELSSRLRLSIDTRTVDLDEYGHVFPTTHPKGGVNYTKWWQIMTRAIESTKNFYTKDLQDLYENAGIVNFDRYSPAQLQRTLRVWQGDPKTIARLKKKNVILSAIDAYGDYNDSARDFAEKIDTEEALLVSEIASPSQAYRHAVALTRKRGIRPSSLAFYSHGYVGTIGWGWGESAFEMVSSADLPTSTTSLDLRAAKLGRFFHEYMKPHSETRERHILLASCNQAEKMEDSRNIPEVVVLATDPRDRVVVRATPEAGNIRRQGELLQFRYGIEVLPTLEFRLPRQSKWERILSRIHGDPTAEQEVVTTQKDTIEYV